MTLPEPKEYPTDFEIYSTFRVCPDCGHLCPWNAATCEECGHVFTTVNHV